MGLFSSKTLTIVSTLAARAIPDAKLPNAIRTGLANAIFRDNGIPESVMGQLVTSIGLRCERMYNYAAAHYTFGLPSGEFHSASRGRPQVEEILRAEHGDESLVLDYCHYGPPNSLHIGWMVAVDNYGYNPATNELPTLSAVKGCPVYLEDLVVVVPADKVNDYQGAILDQWGVSPTAGYTPERPAVISRARTPVLADAAATEEYVRMNIIWQVTVGGTIISTNRESIAIPLSAYDQSADYFHAKWTLGALSGYWIYKDGAGTYPQLDGLFDTPLETIGSFFPFAYFRFNKQSQISDTTSPAYLTTKKMVKYLGIDYDQMADGIDQNPDIADVEQAMLVMAVPAVTSNELERRYLFTFFDNLYASQDNQYMLPIQGSTAASLAHDPNLNRSTIVIQDQRFKMALSNTGIYKKRIGGQIGPVGSHDSGSYTVTVPWTYTSAETSEVITTSVQVKHHYYRRQVSGNLYEELTVTGLQMLYHVLGAYYTTGDATNESILLIPLDHSITHTYTIPEREQLYARSLQYVFNSVQYVKLEWYQQDWFSALLMFAAFIMTVSSLGTLGGPLAAAFEVGTLTAITAAIIDVIYSMLIKLVEGILLQLFVKAVGVDIAVVIALVAALYGGWQMLQSSLENGSVTGAPWAQELLQLSNGLSKAVSSVVADEMKALTGEYTSFLEWKDQALKDLEAGQKLLEQNNWLSPTILFGESPNDFYNRTIHSGNIGINGIGAISNYVEIALRLPTLEDTLGDSTYG